MSILRELKFGLEDSTAFNVLVPMSPEFHSGAAMRERLGQWRSIFLFTDPQFVLGSSWILESVCGKSRK